MTKAMEPLKEQFPGAEYDVVRATMVDRERIGEHLHAHFCPYEPFTMGMGPNYRSTEDDLDWMLKSLPQGFSLMAVIGERIIGVALNGEISSDEVDLREKLKLDNARENTDPVFWEFWHHCERAANFWSDDGPKKALNLEILSVDVQTRGKGIGRLLLEHSRNLARESGYKLFRIDCSSFYAARLAESAGMTCVFTQTYDDYRTKNGEQLYKIPHPHTALKILKQNL